MYLSPSSPSVRMRAIESSRMRVRRSAPRRGCGPRSGSAARPRRGRSSAIEPTLTPSSCTLLPACETGDRVEADRSSRACAEKRLRRSPIRKIAAVARTASAASSSRPTLRAADASRRHRQSPLCRRESRRAGVGGGSRPRRGRRGSGSAPRRERRCGRRRRGRAPGRGSRPRRSSAGVRRVSRIRRAIDAEVIGSSPVVGSSNSSTSGSSASARASATRFFMPPERSDGSLSSMPGSRTEVEQLARPARRSPSSRLARCSRSGKARLSKTCHRIEQGAALEEHGDPPADREQLALRKPDDLAAVEADRSARPADRARSAGAGSRSCPCPSGRG